MNKTFIISEIGINHNGNLNKAFKLIDLAKSFGSDAVKFQSFNTNLLVNKNQSQMPYQIKNNPEKISQYEMLKKCELSFDEQSKIFKYCKTKKIEFISTPYDEESAEFLKKLGVKKIKIASTDSNNLNFLKFIKKLEVDLIISTGVSSLEEIKNSIKIFKNFKKKINLLQCTSSYPCPLREVNLESIRYLHNIFNLQIGFSDHTPSLISGALAVGYGAKIIEKHFTLNKNSIGPDHKASLNPKEMQIYIKNIRDAEIMAGKYEKKIQKSEIKTKKLIQKSIFFKINVNKNHLITENDLIIMRPSNSLEIKNYKKILNKRTKKQISKFKPFSIKDIHC